MADYYPLLARALDALPDRTAGTPHRAELSARLCTEGTALFNDQYPAGTPMAPIVIVIGATEVR